MSKVTVTLPLRRIGAPRRADARVLIVEDQRLFAEFLTLHCRSIGLSVLGNCPTADAAIDFCRTRHPDLVLMDFTLEEGDGLEAARVLMAEFPEMRIIGISSHRDPWTMLQVQRVGLHGFVDKQNPRPDELSRAIRAVLDGETYYTQALSVATATLRKDSNAFIRVLSDYEIQILSFIGLAETDAEIAPKLGISPATVQSRRRDIMRKLDIHTTPKLIHFAIVNGLTRPEHLHHPMP